MSEPAGDDGPWLDKKELGERLRAAGRAIGWHVGSDVLESLIEAGIIPPAQRVGYHGKSPVFRYPPVALRRTLMLADLRREGLEDYDQAMVRLFLADEDFGIEVLKDRIWTEMARAIAKLNAPIRSSYARHAEPLPAGRFTSFVRQLGDLDDIFAAAGLKMPQEVYVELFRMMRLKRYEPTDLSAILGANTSPFIAAIWPMLAPMITRYASGLLISIPRRRTLSDRTPVGRAINEADEGNIRLARILHVQLQKILAHFGSFAESFGANVAAKAALHISGEKASRSVREQREFSVGALAYLLVLIREMKNSGLDPYDCPRKIEVFNRHPKRVANRVARFLFHQK